MYTLLLPGRAHQISDDMASKIIEALENDRAVQRIRVEMNGDGSGEWDVIVNVRQVIALVQHPVPSAAGAETVSGLRLVPN